MVEGKSQESSTLERLKADLDSKDKKLREAQRENESLSSKEKHLKTEIEDLRKKLRDNIVEEGRLESWQFKNRQLQDEFDALKVQLTIKEDEARNFSDRYEKELAKAEELVRVNQELNFRLSSQKVSSENEGSSRDYYERELRAYIEKSQKDSVRIK